MKKIQTYLVLVILVLGGLEAVALKTNDISLTGYKVLKMNNEELDQYQTEITENLTIPIGQIFIDSTAIFNVQLAQSFIPAKKVITKVELFLIKNVTATYPLVVSIRKELTEEDLTSVNIDPEQVPSDEFAWITANFSDIRLQTGQTYYIVALTENTTDNYYGWYGNNMSESYPFGCLWHSLDDGNTWDNKSSSTNQNNIAEWIYQNNNPKFDENITWDMCFKTYGRENMAPGAPLISGQTQGKPGTAYEYTFNAVDPDSDDVLYNINWGDTKTIRTDFNASGKDVKLSHSWSKRGTYIIKVTAEDIDGLVGPEATLKVKMPRIKISELTLIERFLNLFPALQKLLG